MDFRYGSYFGMSPPEAYESLIRDCICGDSTLFAREDEVFNSWSLLTPLLHYWAEKKQSDFPNYPSGTWGPKAADEMMAKDRENGESSNGSSLTTRLSRRHSKRTE